MGSPGLGLTVLHVLLGMATRGRPRLHSSCARWRMGAGPGLRTNTGWGRKSGTERGVQNWPATGGVGGRAVLLPADHEPGFFGGGGGGSRQVSFSNPATGKR